MSSDGSWGEPHSHFDVTLDGDLPADTPELTIPEELQDPRDSVRVNAAVSYDGPQEGLEVIIAPPAWSGPWGLDRALNTGDDSRGSATSIAPMTGCSARSCSGTEMTRCR